MGQTSPNHQVAEFLTRVHVPRAERVQTTRKQSLPVMGKPYTDTGGGGVMDLVATDQFACPSLPDGHEADVTVVTACREQFPVEAKRHGGHIRWCVPKTTDSAPGDRVPDSCRRIVSP